MKRLFKGLIVTVGIIIVGGLLIRAGMKIGYQLVEDIKQDAIEEYKAEEKEKNEMSKQYIAEILTPVKPVSSYILAQEGIAV